MKTSIPMWAMRTAKTEDQGVVRDAHRRGTLQITWPNLDVLRDWAKRQGWPTPWFGFEKAFLTRMLESEESFKLAIDQSGIEIQIPRRDFTISMEELRDLDALYEQRDTHGHPDRWRGLVEELREIRRAVEAGVVVEVEGTGTLRTWQDFYNWAHGRYHMLEDGCDKWIGDDGS